MKNLEFYDVIIVGGGSMGIAAAYSLSKQNKNVLVIDQFSIPNVHSSHHGYTRILRLGYGYGNGGSYVPLVKEALKLWRELEEESGEKLYHQVGALAVGHSESKFVRETIESSIKHNLKYEAMSAKRIMETWPGISIPQDYIGSHDPESGFLLSEECIRTYKSLALKNGAVVKENEAVKEIKYEDKHVEVVTKKASYKSAKLIVTAGAWTTKLLQSLDLPIQPVRKTVGWFEQSDEQLYSNDFPCFVFDTKEEGQYYGFPDFDGTGVKIGRMDLGHNTNPDDINKEFGAFEDDEEDLRTCLSRYMPRANGNLNEGKVCMFSNTPDSDFIVDKHPAYPNVVIAGGFSGHGFKFSSVIGAILAELAITGETSRDISFLGLSRFKQPVSKEEPTENRELV